jgi:hypothetical protein
MNYVSLLLGYVEMVAFGTVLNAFFSRDLVSLLTFRRPSNTRYYDEHIDLDIIENEIRRERLYGRRPDLEPRPIKGAQISGVVLIFAGIFMIMMIFAVLAPRGDFSLFSLGLICFPIPITFVIIGILLLYNKRSGKLMFALICITFGIVILVFFLLNLGSSQHDERSGAGFAASMGIMIYGFYLFRRHMVG